MHFTFVITIFLLVAAPTIGSAQMIASATDLCEENGLYADGNYCDEHCLQLDPDCEEGLPSEELRAEKIEVIAPRSKDPCEGVRNDGVCDSWCKPIDSDCLEEAKVIIDAETDSAEQATLEEKIITNIVQQDEDGFFKFNWLRAFMLWN